jgi:hypothetical protein
MANNFKTLTFTTASIASGASLSTNTTGMHNYLDILKVTVVPNTAGVAFRFEIYKKDTFASDICYRSRQVPGGETLVDPFDEETGDEREEGFILPYQDDDATGEIHSKLYNYGPSSSTFTVTIIYREVAMLIQKPANETVSASAALQDDDDFVFSLQAASLYRFRGMLFFSGTGTGGMKLALGGTVTSTLFKSASTVKVNPAGVTQYIDVQGTLGTQQLARDFSPGDTGWVEIEGTILTNAAGTLRVQWAQNTATGTLTIQNSSYFEVTPAAA